MAMKFRKGDQVELIQPVIAGPITEVAIIDDEVQYAVEYIDASDGTTHTRYFREDQLQARG